MRAFLALILLTLSLPALADPYDELYRSAGWAEQRAHFGDALGAAQTRYRNTLPPAIYEALVRNSDSRFAPAAMDQRAISTLRQALADPQPALAFYQSPLGRKIVAAETKATTQAELLRHANGLPTLQAGSNRELLIRHLAQALPITEAGAEVSLALAGMAADSLSQMLPGVLGGAQADGLLQEQRQRLMQQMAGEVDNTLLYVYRDLSDPELEEYVQFAQSEAGQAYYRAALAALRAALNPPQG